MNTSTNGRKVTAIYSGTFDPPHSGHAIVANYVAQWGGVDEVWMTVSPLNPLKAGTNPVSETLRMQMAEAVASRCRNVRASDFELSLPRPSYTFHTLCELRRAFPDRDFRLVIGSDNWDNFMNWRDPVRIISEFGLIIYPRPGYGRPDSLPENTVWLDGAPQVVMSSTFVRQALADGRDINYFVPTEVADIIIRHGLYQPDK